AGRARGAWPRRAAACASDCRGRRPPRPWNGHARPRCVAYRCPRAGHGRPRESRPAARRRAHRPGYGDTRLARATALAVVEPKPTEVRIEIARLGLVPLRGPAWALAGPTTLT